jgi:hypothetical protein
MLSQSFKKDLFLNKNIFNKFKISESNVISVKLDPVLWYLVFSNLTP